MKLCTWRRHKKISYRKDWNAKGCMVIGQPKSLSTIITFILPFKTLTRRIILKLCTTSYTSNGILIYTRRTKQTGGSSVL
jgi:hypothetical protein